MKSTVANDRIRRVVRTILGGVSTLSLGVLSAPALAQNAPTQSTAPSATPAEEPLQEITVTGIRASLQRALDVKQQSVGVVDAISAEDIGQFPDANLGAAIQRIPGVSVNRGLAGGMGGLPTTTGDATQITVRGFGPTFNESLYDGRISATATGDRGFDFSAVGSNFVQEVDILKTPDATLSAGAIGATINVKFPKPFDSPGLKIAASGSASYSPHDGQATPNGGLLFSDTFANDTFGVLAFVDYSKSALQNNHINVQGWPGAATGTDPNQINPSQYAPGQAPAAGSPNWFIQDYGIYKEYVTDVRKDARLVFQWKPIDSMVVTLDDTRSEHDLTSQDYGFSVWFNPGTINNLTRDANGTLTSWTENTPTDFQGQFTGLHTLNNMAGLNVAWDINDSFKAELDADQSKARLNPNWQTSSIDADVGYGGTQNNTNLTLTGIGGNALPYLLNYGPNGNTANYLGQGIIGSHVFPIQVFRNVDTVNQAKIQGTWSSDSAKLKFGFQYTDDTFALAQWDTFANNNWQAYSGYGPASGNAVGVALPQSYFTSSFSTRNFVPGFANLNNLPPSVLMYSPYTILNYLNGLHGPGNIVNGQGCCTPPFSGTYQLALNTGTVQNIEEKIYAPYLSLAQTTEIGGMKLQTVFGARYESTELSTAAISKLPTSLAPTAGDATNFTVLFGPQTLVTSSTNYRYLLPSLDLNLQITPDLKARFDASRTMTRAPLNQINPTLNLPTAERVNSLVANGGNPNLLPFLSDNVDLGVEWYYAPNSYVSVDGFVKEVTNFIVAGTVTEPIGGVTDPTHGGQVAQFSVTTNVNGPSAEVRGIEIGVQHMFWDTGFGVQANATFVDTSKPYDPANTLVSNFAVPGLANSANFVAFFEKWGFHARVAVNWEDSYLARFGQQQNTGNFGTEPTFVDSATFVDFSTSYDIDNNLSVFFEGLNLTDETYSTHGRYKAQLLDAIDTGPRLTVGARYKF